MTNILKVKLLQTLIDKTTDNKLIWNAEVCSRGFNYICHVHNGAIIVCRNFESPLPNVFLKTDDYLKHLIIRIVNSKDESENNREVRTLSLQLVSAIIVNMNEREDWEDWIADVIASLPD